MLSLRKRPAPVVSAPVLVRMSTSTAPLAPMPEWRRRRQAMPDQRAPIMVTKGGEGPL